MPKSSISRRARGTGSIRKDEKRGCWVGRLPVGRNLNGTTRYVERSGPTQKAVIEALRVAGPPGPQTTVAEWCDRWLAEMERSGVRESSRYAYTNAATKWFKPTLGTIRVNALKIHHVEAAVREWSASEDIESNSVRIYFAYLRTCLNAAVRAGLLAVNPCAGAKRPKGTKPQIDPFTPDELARIIVEANAVSNGRVIALLAGTGCRSGEAFALLASDWSAESRTISITKTMPQKKGWKIGPPKSSHSIRTIRVPSSVRVPDRKSGPLFPTVKGALPRWASVRDPWKRILKNLGIRLRNVHQLRHSVATAMISAGVPIGDVAKYLGDTPETIVRTYLHATGADPSLAMEKILSGKVS